jgi:hypothetical protein
MTAAITVPARVSPGCTRARAGIVLQNLRRGLWIEPWHLAGLLLCSAFFSGWLASLGSGLTLGVAAYFLLLPVAAYYAGRAVLAPVRSGCLACRSLPLLLLTGCLALALALCVVRLGLPGSLRLHALLVAGAFVLLQGRVAGQKPREQGCLTDGWVGLFVIGFALVAATFWARGLLRSVQGAGDEIVYRNWMDFFIHANLSARFLPRETVWSLGNYELHRSPAALYHYASYLFPATLAAFTGTGTYDAVLALWTPLGTFLTGLAAYCLTASWAGRGAGLCAAVALLVLPDPSSYGFRHPAFGYHWKQQIAPTMLYGLACAGLVLIFLWEGMRQRSGRVLLGAVGWTGALFLFNGKLFVQAAPLLFGWFLLCYPRVRVTGRLLLLAAVAGLGLLAIWCKNRLHIGPHLGPDWSYFENYTHTLAELALPGAFRVVLETPNRPVIYALCALSLICLATLGVWLLAYPVLIACAAVRRRLHSVDLLPGLACAVYAFFIVGLRDDVVGHNWFELLWAPFGWPYFVALTWCVGKGYVLLRDLPPARSFLRRPVIALLGVVLLVIPFRLGSTVQEGRTVWRLTCCNLHFPRGQVDCARFIRAASARLDLVQDGQCDPHLLVGGLTERRAFLARPFEWSKNAKLGLAETVQRKQEALGRLRQASTKDELRQAALDCGIRWYLAHPDEALGWPEGVRRAPVFRSGGFCVYDLGRVGSEPAKAALLF